ncbi:MAG: hypothetical protein JO051_16410 [Acidobacteriaceae bacterium]|nr:hypothetical protein [Acidobacteriaceae bacterium]
MTLTFSGNSANGSAHGVWVDRAGRHGQIEFAPVPGRANLLKVVWSGGDSKQVFDEILHRD